MLLKRIILATSLILLSFLKSHAQVSLQNGTAVFSLPMFNWQDDKSRLTSVVALSYSSGNGLKANDVASNVGQGWNLSAGGVIARMQVGEPDDQPEYHQANPNGEQDDDLTKYPAGYLYHSIDPALGCPNSLIKYPIYKSKNQLYAPHNVEREDKQLDHFSFQFNGKAGMFILDTVGGDHGIPIGDTKLQITFTRDPTMVSQGIRTTITSFSIQDVDGLIYKFSQHGLTRVLCQEFCDQGLTTPIAQPTFKDHGIYYQYGFQIGYNGKQMVHPFIIGSWYLSEIDDPLTGRKVTFNYAAYSRTINNYAGADVSWNQWHNYIIIDNRYSMTTVPTISSINYPDSHRVVFNYAATPRVDLSGDTALASVDIQYQGRYVSEYQLNTTYFILNRYGTPTTPYQKSVARLCLKSVKKIGVDLKEDSPPYIFDYYTGSNATDDFVPPPFFYAKDVWGFYNGTNSVGYSNTSVNLTYTSVNMLGWDALQGLCFVNPSTANAYTDPVSGFSVFGVYLNPKAGYAQNGLLKQIVYPTGGSLTYSYAQNTGSLMGSSTVGNLGGVHVSQTSSADGGYSNGCANPVVTSYNYVMNGAGSASSLWGMETPINMQVSGSHYAPEQKGFHCNFTSGCGCYWHFMYPGILSVGEAISLSSFQNFMNSIAPVLTVLTVIMDVIDVINVCLDDTPAAIIAVILDVIAILVTIGISCFHNYNKDGATPVYHSANLNDVSPLPAQFKRVEIIENPGTIGKTVQQFTSSDDYPLWLPGANTAFSAKQRFAPWAYGLPTFKTVYDNIGNIIKQTKNVYDFTNASEQIWEYAGKQFGNIAKASCKCLVEYSYSQRNTDWTQPSTYTYSATNYTTTSNSDMLVDIYNMYSGRVELDSTYERTYRVGDATQYVETYTTFFYDPQNYEVATMITKQSNGVFNVKDIFYTADYYFNSGLLSTMAANYNIMSLPVATRLSMNDGVHGNTVLSEKVTEFTQVANGDIRPTHTMEQRFNKPSGTFTAYPGPVTVNYANYKILQSFTYDGNSNLVGLKDEGNRSLANIYDYNDKYITASVVNADPVVDKPAVTSFETAGFGGWVLTGSPGYSSVAVITGTRGFNLPGNTLTASINTAKPYILSFWANLAGVTISAGATLTKSGPVYNGMRYYEYAIAQGTASVSVTGTCTIDELRLYPATAQVHSTTYDPLIGKTSECDANSRISYYTYDNLGRLQLIKDEALNIVKMYEYNNVSPTKQNGCPGTYYSHLLSETVYKSNCAAGYQPGAVTFTLPANKYTSTSSQWDADLQAEIDLLTNAQNYANANGSCSLIYYNGPHSETDSTQSCAEGFVGGLVTYTVPANRYSSIVSQAVADQQALDELAANAQAYANSPAHAVCTVSTAPDWTWLEGDSTYCFSVGGALPPHQFVQETDLNPNSPTYHQRRWMDAGPQDYCPAGNYYNAARSQSFTKSCSAGYVGSSVIYSVPVGKYSSTVSQAAADQQAINEITANGQNNANALGTCSLPCSYTFTWSSSIVQHATGTVSINGAVVTFKFTFLPPYNGWAGGTIGTITGSCTPLISNSVEVIDNLSRHWNVSIQSGVSGVNLSLISGPPTTTTTSIIINGTYTIQ